MKTTSKKNENEDNPPKKWEKNEHDLEKKERKKRRPQKEKKNEYDLKIKWNEDNLKKNEDDLQIFFK
jgi:urease accessory protein UreE